MKDLNALFKYRSIHMQHELGRNDLDRSIYGIFSIPLTPTESATVIAHNGITDSEWEYVSVSFPDRYPTWEEMCKIKDMFFAPDEVVIQIHPVEKHYTRFCLYLWRPKTKCIPLPPSHLML